MSTAHKELLGAELPIVVAPMAGGPTTTALVAAAGRAGALGVLAAGYKKPDAVAAEISTTRSLGIPFGVNVFVPAVVPITEADYRRYAQEINADAHRYGLDLTDTPLVCDDDDWDAKIDVLVNDAVPLVSFTFGIPDPDTMRRLRRSGTRVLVTVTSASEAEAADAAGGDALIVQGTEAGGHSAVHDPTQRSEPLPLRDLLVAVRRVSALPLIATGGIATAEQLPKVLSAGATAVMVGTVLLRSDESGASPVHKDALADPGRTQTVVTTAFTGRPARALRNEFTDRHDATAPLGYPALHHLTRPLRWAAARAGDPENIHLWAGTGYRHARTGPAERIITDLARPL